MAELSVEVLTYAVNYMVLTAARKERMGYVASSMVSAIADHNSRYSCLTVNILRGELEILLGIEEGTLSMAPYRSMVKNATRNVVVCI